MVLELVGDDLDFVDTDIEGLSIGANRLLVGGEVIQFAHAEAIGVRQWRLHGLLRGRGGTEAEAALGYAVQTSVILLDDTLVPLDPAEVPALSTTRIAAIGTGDSEVVVADLENPGLSRRPLTPVHPRLTITPDDSWQLGWTRRARGQWGWDDLVDVPLVEETERYIVGYGPVAAPLAAWSVTEPHLLLSTADRALLIAAHGPAGLWVRQVGTFDQSHPLLLAQMS
jgi:hypothetical protein